MYLLSRRVVRLVLLESTTPEHRPSVLAADYRRAAIPDHVHADLSVNQLALALKIYPKLVCCNLALVTPSSKLFSRSL